MNSPRVDYPHTAEPWRIDDHNNFVIVAGKGFSVGDCVPGNPLDVSDDQGKTNARRIVACVNACAGMPNDMGAGSVKRVTDALASAKERISALRTQRDELAAELRHIARQDVRMNASTHVAPQASADPFAWPRVNAYWDGQGGQLRGICPGQNGAPDYFLIEADDELPHGPWHMARDEAAKLRVDGHQDFSLPTPAEAALLYATARFLHEPTWYWSTEAASMMSYASAQDFHTGTQDYYLRKDTVHRARAVRRVPIE